MFFVFFFSSRRRHTRYWRDWSSDVCSSDLGDDGHAGTVDRDRVFVELPVLARDHLAVVVQERELARPRPDRMRHGQRREIGRASCRERVEISVVAVSLKKKKKKTKQTGDVH